MNLFSRKIWHEEKSVVYRKRYSRHNCRVIASYRRRKYPREAMVFLTIAMLSSLGVSLSRPQGRVFDTSQQLFKCSDRSYKTSPDCWSKLPPAIPRFITLSRQDKTLPHPGIRVFITPSRQILRPKPSSLFLCEFIKINKITRCEIIKINKITSRGMCEIIKINKFTGWGRSERILKKGKIRDPLFAGYWF